jgi:hypothetical protein
MGYRPGETDEMVGVAEEAGCEEISALEHAWFTRTYLTNLQVGHARSPIPETCNFDAHCALLRSASKQVIDPHLIVRI